MIKADRYVKETIEEILKYGDKDKNPRPKWSDGTPAHTQFVTQKVFKYDILKGEFPITTLRKTALKGAFHDIESIFIKQTNIIEDMNPSIWSWWEDFVVDTTWFFKDEGGGVLGVTKDTKPNYEGYTNCRRSIGQTYGHTVKRYDLMNKLINGMAYSPFSRRHMINLWQEQQMIDDPQALVPCAYMTNWNIREKEWKIEDGNTTYRGGILDFSKEPSWNPLIVRYVDLTLHQRSQDFCMTASINPAQYCMFGMMVCGHLTYTTGIVHELANFMHIVENCHIYDRHFDAAQEILEREPILTQPMMYLGCEPKNFYDYTIEDFIFVLPKGIEPLSDKLEIAI